MRSECTESLNSCQEPFLDSRLLNLLHQHRDLCRLRLALTREIEALERQIEVVEQATCRAVSPGAAVTTFALN